MTLIFRSRLNETAVMVLCGILKLKFLGVNLAYACLKIKVELARTQSMPGHSMDTLHLRVALYPRPHPALYRLQYGNAEATGGGLAQWGMLPPKKIWAFLSIPQISVLMHYKLQTSGAKV